MSKHILISEHSLADVARFFGEILGPERRYYALAIIYGIGISLLSLATPISVQMLINTVAYTGLITPLVVLSLSLFALLIIAGLLNALRIHLMDLFSRRFYARLVSEVALRAIYAVNPFFDDDGNGTLFNRYFDIVVVVKSLPNLLVGGFTIVLQTFVGFVLVSLYHPMFLAFNVVLAILIWMIWAVWGKRAMRSAIELSHRKHATAAWLEGLGTSNGFFKSERHIDDALDYTDAVTRNYIDQHKLHFRHHFSQTICFLLLYAVASALLLGIGGWLVIRGELTLGQLVAAELVLSVVFVGISQMGIYLTYFYDLGAAIDELSLFYKVKQEQFVDDPQEPADSSLEFVQAKGESRGIGTVLDLAIPPGARVLAHADSHAVQRIFSSFLKGHEPPAGGYISLGGVDLDTIPSHTLRQQVIVLDRPNIIEMEIRELLRLSDDGAKPGALLEALEAVGLQETIASLDDGLDTRIAATGWPLSIAETMQLKLASTIIARPRVVVLNQLYDVLSDETMLRSLELLSRVTDGGCTVIYFSNHTPPLDFDQWIVLGTETQSILESESAYLAELMARTGLPAKPDQRGPVPDF